MHSDLSSHSTPGSTRYFGRVARLPWTHAYWPRMAARIIVSQTPKSIILQGQCANDWDRTERSIGHSHERGVSLVRVSPFVSGCHFSNRVHGHITRRTIIFRFKSMSEEKWTAGQGHKAEPVRCNLSYFIFPQWGAILLDGLQKGEKWKTEDRTRTWKLYFTRFVV